jgi:hypothetical protein
VDQFQHASVWQSLQAIEVFEQFHFLLRGRFILYLCSKPLTECEGHLPKQR